MPKFNAFNILDQVLLFPTWEIYGLVHVGRQPEREICKEKNLKIQWEEKGT